MLAVYPVMTSRRTAFDTMMWQVPALGLTAQAFLLTIALGHDSRSAARLISASLAFVIAVISIQTMAKWRHGEVIDSILIQRLEDLLGAGAILGVDPHAKLAERACLAQRSLPWWVTKSSYRLWTVGLWLFGVASLIILGLTLFDVALL